MLSSVDDYIEIDLVHSIHTSGSKSFRGCRRRWDWLFNGYYYPKTTAKPLEFGVAYHKAMEVFYDPRLWTKPREAITEMAIQTFRDRCEKQLKLYESYHGDASDDILKDYKDRKELGEGMIRYHAEKVAPELHYGKYKPIQVEVSFEVAIVSPVTGEQLYCKCESCWSRYSAYLKTLSPAEVTPHLWPGLPVTYGGRLDCLMQDEETDELWIFDWKTCATLAEDRNEFLLLDDQISRYVWALRLLGIDVRGFIYHEQKKAFPDEPEPMKVRRLGRNFSVSKQLAVDAKTYQRVVSENDPEAYHAGLYDEFIDWLSKEGGKFHASYTVYRNEYENAETGKNIFLEAEEMVDPNLNIYPNAGRFSCGNCAFRQPCLSKNDGGDYLYALESMFEKRRYHYWVEHEPSTESKGNE